MKKYSNGFTVIELIFITIIIGIAGIFFFIQKNDLAIMAQDSNRKTAINAMYYSLEEVFFPANSFYPQSISSENLKSVDPDLFTDPDGLLINTEDSSYTYKPTNCIDGKCKSYSLKANLQKEDDYIKKSRNN